MKNSNPFKWKQFQGDIILLCTRWYLRYALTYRDLVEMMAERGLSMVHTTIMRWVHQYSPELDKEHDLIFGKPAILGSLMRLL